MSFTLDRILDEFRRDYYDPRDPFARMEYEENQRKVNFSFGIVTDNQDPDNRGRIKVHLPMIVQGYISKWIWVFRPYGGANKGVWCLPDINDQVMIAFIGGDVNQPVCIGGMYTPRHRPPIKDNKDNVIKAIKTKGTYCLIDDTAGEERIEASVKDGKIRAVIDKDGVHLTNELGDIALKCKTMSVKSESSSWDIKKDVTIKTGGDLTIKTSKTFGITAKKDITINGKSIDLQGSTGVTA